MGSTLNFALNHITAPSMDCRAFIDLASSLGCVGVELRNDLESKKLATRPFFDGESPADIGEYSRSKGVRLLGLSEVYGFNRWSANMSDQVSLLIAQAKESGAETISLIPRNDCINEPDDQRLADLRNALANILPMLRDAQLTALIEPLGFETSSLRRKREAIDAIIAVGGDDRFKLVHDTFHHFIAGETEFFPEWTGIVHISGVVDPGLKPNEMGDEHRILVDENDRLQNIRQISTLSSTGYDGAYSYESFAPAVHKEMRIAESLSSSMRHIGSFLRS